MAMVRIEGTPEHQRFSVADDAWSTYLAIADSGNGALRYLCNPAPDMCMRFCLEIVDNAPEGRAKAVIASVLLMDKTGECPAIPMWAWPMS